MQNIDYNPIEEIVNIIGSKFSLVERNKQNELLFIREAILTTFKEDDKLKEHIERQKPIIRINFLQKLIKGDIQKNSSLVQDLEFNNISFQSEYFLVVIVHNESLTNDINEIKRSQIYYLITKTLMDHIMPYGLLLDLELEEEFVYIINLSDYHAAETCDFKNVLTKAKEHVKERMDIDLSIAFSEIENGVLNIRKAYEKAKKTMEYRFVIGKGNVISIKDIEGISYGYDYSIEDENKLINWIVNGNKEEMKALIDDIFKRNLNMRSISVEFGRCLFYNLISTTVNVFKNLDIRVDSCFETRMNPMEEMINCSTIQDLKEKIITICEKICDQVGKNKKSHNFMLTKLITEYIYQDI